MLRDYKSLPQLILLTSLFAFHHVANAQDIPGSADAGRIITEQRKDIKPYKKDKPKFEELEEHKAPKGAEELSFILKSVAIEGLTAFEPKSFEWLFANKINKKVSADFIWELAAKITKIYKDKGYFLSRAYVPQQTVSKGNIRIIMIEGYIANVQIEGKNSNDFLVVETIKQILEETPVNRHSLERTLLRLNDLHGFRFDAYLTRDDDQRGDATILKLFRKEEQKTHITLSTNNYGSRFVGPYRTGLSIEHVFKDYHRTIFSAQATIPETDELILGSVNHNIQITPAMELDFLFSYTKSEPGFTLRQSEIESNSFIGEFATKWRVVRQRNKNITLSAIFSLLNGNTDFLTEALTRDKVRALRTTMDYDFVDNYAGSHSLSTTLSRGIDFLDASNRGDDNISRADSKADFTKIDFNHNYQKILTDNFLLSTNISGQLSSGSLFSSEEFGYGGSNIGRAYDFSEITGDQGIAGLVEINYLDIRPIDKYKIIPFIFYDIGKVWEEGDASVKQISGASAGLGARAYDNDNISIDLNIAYPLTKQVDNPIYGNDKNPVFRFGLTYKFK